MEKEVIQPAIGIIEKQVDSGSKARRSQDICREDSQKFKYPKLALFIFTIILAYFIFTIPFFNGLVSKVSGFGYLSIFLAGILYAYGFTASFAVGILFLSNPSNIFLAGIIAGFGALLSDLLIFRLIKTTFMDEFSHIKRTKGFIKFRNMMKNNVNAGLNKFILYILTVFVIASPLPDEIGVTMLAGLTKIDQKFFSLISFSLNAMGIILILVIASL